MRALCLCGLQGDSDATSDGSGSVASGAEECNPDTEDVSQHPDDLRTVRHFFGGCCVCLTRAYDQHACPVVGCIAGGVCARPACC